MIRNLSIEQATNQVSYHSLKGILQEHSGDKNQAKVPVIAIIGTGENRQLVRLGEDYWVKNDQSVVEALKKANFNAYPTPLVSDLSS